MINDLCKKVHANAIEKGFYEDGKATNMGERIALIHAEVSEALEADRKDSYCSCSTELFNNIKTLHIDEEFKYFYQKVVKGTFEEEMADIVIRVMDMCAYKGIDLEGHILAKMRYNSMREKMHGKAY